MSSTLVIILFSAGAVGLFMLGMSLTLIFKGHNMRSEIGDNPHMKARGIKCAVSEAHEQESSEKPQCNTLHPAKEHNCDDINCTNCN